MAETVNIVKPFEDEAEIEELQKLLSTAAASYRVPTPFEKVIAKMKEDPFLAFLPIGCVATLCALSVGLLSFKNDRKVKSQTMMRVRLVTQGLTLAAICVAMGMRVNKKD